MELQTRMKPIFLTPLVLLAGALAYGQAFPVPDKVVSGAFAGREGAFVMIDCDSGNVSDFRPESAAEKLAPCSTFKIWNTLIGLETGAIKSADEAFYQWDGQRRSIPEWNKDLTLKEAFNVSCVPAFQELARKIGPEEMQAWVDRIGYGDQDLSAGIDVFWLPVPGRKTVLTTPMEQADLIRRLITGNLPFSGKSRVILREIMVQVKTPDGAFHGKTGSGTDGKGHFNLGWFVGHVENKGRSYAFACVVKGLNLSGRDARGIVEEVLKKQGLLKEFR